MANIKKQIQHLLGNQKGFTLIELLVAMCITVLLGAAAVAIFLSSSQVYSNTIIQNEQQLIMDGVTEYLNDSLRYAMALDDYSPGESVPYEMTAIWCENGKLYSTDHYVNSQDALVFDFQSQTNQSLDIAFSYDGSGIITADICVTSTANAEKQTAYSQSIRLLNLDFGFTAPSATISGDTGIAFHN
ncbi:prepilin-type N-terminal cleavage/methylation domain-containing protein [Bengtsoniella intestinalis]|uniref:PilW family protein n=1 Tax=Bengtsoniella intestinalis TaxID=3073143 RepID=UPI00391F2D94